VREVLTVEQYQAELAVLVEADARVEEVPLAAAAGRVLADAVRSASSLPPFDNSAMDGYAVRFADVADVPVVLAVAGESRAGSAETPSAAPGACVRIMTGAPLPAFADTVVPLEDTDRSGGSRVEVEGRGRPGEARTSVRPVTTSVSALSLPTPGSSSLRRCSAPRLPPAS